MKPWEETWTSSDGYSLDVAGGPNLVEINIGPPERERLALASAAPDMARVLLAIEWSGGDPGSYNPYDPEQCPSCGAAREKGHGADCFLDAALRKAGVR